MAKVTNTHRITPIGLPSGLVILPGTSEDVPDWEEVKKRQNIAFYVKTGVLVADGESGGTGTGTGSDEAAYRAELFAELAALGINAHPNSKTDTLVAKLAEAKKKAQPQDEAAQKQALIDELAALGVPAGPDASLEELQAALTAKKAEQQ